MSYLGDYSTLAPLFWHLLLDLPVRSHPSLFLNTGQSTSVYWFILLLGLVHCAGIADALNYLLLPAKFNSNQKIPEGKHNLQWLRNNGQQHTVVWKCIS